MTIFDIFKKKGTLTGEVVLRGLPAHKMYSVGRRQTALEMPPMQLERTSRSPLMASLDDMNNGHRLLTVLWLSAAALAPDLKHPFLCSAV